jgi:hypothetical protein
MDADKQAKIQAHAQAIAALLYEETDQKQVQTLAGIEAAVREHVLEHVTPEIGNFLLQQVVAQRGDANAPSPALLDD